ncbi:MAG: PHP domain-containing protein [Deltaproteobacteria bacterium]|nr:PHP domain-containing protein [Deltaproteobacteria bacterium]
MGQADLHIHSTASDGRLTPAEVVKEAARQGLKFIALADHDTVDGIAPAKAAAKSFPGLKVIPGVEISTDIPQGEAHVLGYFIDYASRELEEKLDLFRNSRLKRAQGMVAKLDKLDIHLDWPRVQQIAGSSVMGRPHIALAMLEKGYIDSFKQAFTDYIGHDGPAYVEREKITPAEAVALIIKARGLAVLAHPFTINEPEAMIIELKAADLAGIEAYYNNYTAEEVSRLVAIARKHNLIATGGSDYHGLDSSETAIGGIDLPLASVEKLIAKAKKINPGLNF